MKDLLTKFILLMSFFAFCFSCKNENVDDGSVPYDSKSSVVLEDFEPSVGGLGTKVLISGKNLGNDPSLLKVYFNDKPAPVIGCDKGKALILTPRQPGDTCTISVVIGKDSLVFDKKFRYNILTIVTTLVGKKGTAAFKPGSFAEAEFHNPAFLAVDNEKNLFLAHWGHGSGHFCIALINQQEQMVVQLNPFGIPVNVPSMDISGDIIMFPDDSGDKYFLCDPQVQWAPRNRLILHPSEEEQKAGKKDFHINWKHGFAVCEIDSCIYTRGYNGQLVKFDPTTRIGEQVAIDLAPNSDSYLLFSKEDPHLLYLSYPSRHCIYTYNILTKEHKMFAGRVSDRGWRDGAKEDAQFNTPRQIVFDVNGDLIIADSQNHCIRKIEMKTGMASTLIGIGGKAGYLDGNPDFALFREPRGLAIDNDYTIYIADYGNNCIRKLSVE